MIQQCQALSQTHSKLLGRHFHFYSFSISNQKLQWVNMLVGCSKLVIEVGIVGWYRA